MYDDRGTQTLDLDKETTSRYKHFSALNRLQSFRWTVKISIPARLLAFMSQTHAIEITENAQNPIPS